MGQARRPAARTETAAPGITPTAQGRVEAAEWLAPRCAYLWVRKAGGGEEPPGAGPGCVWPMGRGHLIASFFFFPCKVEGAGTQGKFEA